MQAEEERRHVEQYKEQVKQMFCSYTPTPALAHLLLHTFPSRWKKLSPA